MNQLNQDSCTEPNVKFSAVKPDRGIIAGLTGRDFTIVAGESYSVENIDNIENNGSRLYQLSDYSVIAISGVYGTEKDFINFIRKIILNYQETLSPDQVVYTDTLVKRLEELKIIRKYRSDCLIHMIAGLDSRGDTVCYSYVTTGFYIKQSIQIAGADHHLNFKPYLLNQLNSTDFSAFSMRNSNKRFDIDHAVQLLKHTYIFHANNDLYYGKYVDVLIITQDGIRGTRFKISNN